MVKKEKSIGGDKGSNNSNDDNDIFVAVVVVFSGDPIKLEQALYIKKASQISFSASDIDRMNATSS